MRFCVCPRTILGTLRTMGGDALSHRNFEAPLRLGLVVETIQRLPLQAVAHGALDGVHLRLLGGRREGQCVADLAGACGATDPVNVVFGLHRHVEVDDMWQSFDIDIERCAHCGGNLKINCREAING